MMPANYSGLLRAIFAGAAVATVVALLAGCDLGTGDHVPDFSDQYNYTVCTQYTMALQDTASVEVVDSTATCADGSEPFLLQAEWISTDATCPAVLSTIVGGFGGIRHRYGCWRPAAKWAGPPL
jgi:hypothetical protein